MKSPPKMRCIIIGPLPPDEGSKDEIIGGTKILFSETVRELQSRGIDLHIINSSRPRPNLPLRKILFYGLLAFIRVLWGVLRHIRKTDLVFLNMSAYPALIVATTIWLICRASGRPLVLRFFGGQLWEVYSGYIGVARWLADRTFLRSSLIYVETRQLLRDFNEPANFRWLPNTRDIASPLNCGRDRVRDLIFVAQLRSEKGLAEALSVCRSLPDGCHLNVYGPAMPNTDFSMFEDHPKATYRGVLESDQLVQVLSEHSLLLFPSYYRGEGYPGIIIESFQCGVPVIASMWRFIPELVQHEENGLLVEPRSESSLGDAVHRLLEDPDLYLRLCDGAKQRGEFFRNSKWYDEIVKDLRSLV